MSSGRARRKNPASFFVSAAQSGSVVHRQHFSKFLKPLDRYGSTGTFWLWTLESCNSHCPSVQDHTWMPPAEMLFDLAAALNLRLIFSWVVPLLFWLWLLSHCVFSWWRPDGIGAPWNPDARKQFTDWQRKSFLLQFDYGLMNLVKAIVHLSKIILGWLKLRGSLILLLLWIHVWFLFLSYATALLIMVIITLQLFLMRCHAHKNKICVSLATVWTFNFKMPVQTSRNLQR